MKKSRLLCLAVFSVAAPAASAAIFTWDTFSTAGIQAGNGTWNTAAVDPVWNKAGTNIIWSSANEAVFGWGGDRNSYAITVGGSFCVRNLTPTSGVVFMEQPGLAVDSDKTFTIGLKLHRLTWVQQPAL